MWPHSAAWIAIKFARRHAHKTHTLDNGNCSVAGFIPSGVYDVPLGYWLATFQEFVAPSSLGSFWTERPSLIKSPGSFERPGYHQLSSRVT
jgi:hypothetical protein